MEGQVLLMPLDDKLNPEFFERVSIGDASAAKRAKKDKLSNLVRGNTGRIIIK